MKDKFNDNKLAEEFDLTVLTDDGHKHHGLPHGSLGTLTYSYTGKNKPLYAEFAVADGTRVEEPLSLYDFRVLNERNARDISLITEYLKRLNKINRVRDERFSNG